MKHETFIPVKCPGPRSGEPCGRFLQKIALSHHSLNGQKCPGCGTLWRIFHDSDSPIVELTLVQHLEDYHGEVITQVSFGRDNVRDMQYKIHADALACGGM